MRGPRTKLGGVRVLSIVHGDNARSGIFGDVVRERGHELDELSYAFGKPPKEPETYDAVMVFGGAMNVHEVDGHPWLAEESRTLARLLDAEVPTLGVCLGSQMLAAVAGARVSRAPEPEIGWYDVEATPEAAADPVFAGLPDRFTAFQWHSYQFELPPGARALATSPVCLQGYRIAEFAWGIQFHAEVTREIAAGWIDRYATDPDAIRLGIDPVREHARLEREIGRWNELGRALVAAFLDFADPDARERPRTVPEQTTA